MGCVSRCDGVYVRWPPFVIASSIWTDQRQVSRNKLDVGTAPCSHRFKRSCGLPWSGMLFEALHRSRNGRPERVSPTENGAGRFSKSVLSEAARFRPRHCSKNGGGIVGAGREREPTRNTRRRICGTPYCSAQRTQGLPSHA